MTRKRGFSLVSILVILAMMLTACSGSKKEEPAKPADPPKQQEAPKPAAKVPATGGELVIAVPADPDSFASFWAASAYSSTVTSRVFGDGLLGINSHTLQLEPDLAEAMPTVGADNKTYTFKLRKGVKFHDGTEVKAQDVAFTYEILMDKDYKGRWKSAVTDIESVKVVDDYTIEFKTKQVVAPFLYTSISGIYPIPKAKLAGVAVKDMATHDFWKKPIGAGPWKFVEWKAGQHTLLERFDDYWQKGKDGGALVTAKDKKGVIGPYFDKVRIRVIPEENTTIAALEAGELSLEASIAPEHVERLKKEKGDQLAFYDWDRMGFGYQTFNLEKYPTDNKAVREALSFALNRPAIIQGVLNGRATLPAGFVPPIHWVFNKDLKATSYDMKKAAEVLEKDGFKKNANGIYEKDGKPLKIVYVGTKGSSIVEGVALQSQKDWKALGIDVDLQLVDFNTLLKGFKEGTFNVTFSGLGFAVDPHSSFHSRFHSSNIRKDAKGLVQGSNTARYSNKQVDALIEKGKVTLDQAARKPIYQEAEALIMADYPILPIYVNLWTDAIQKKIKGVSVANGYGLVYTNQYYVNEK